MRLNRLQGRIEGLDAAERNRIFATVLTKEAIVSSLIEGENLDAQAIANTLNENLSIGGSGKTASSKEEGIADLMRKVASQYADPLSKSMLVD